MFTRKQIFKDQHYAISWYIFFLNGFLELRTDYENTWVNNFGPSWYTIFTFNIALKQTILRVKLFHRLSLFCLWDWKTSFIVLGPNPWQL